MTPSRASIEPEPGAGHGLPGMPPAARDWRSYALGIALFCLAMLTVEGANHLSRIHGPFARQMLLGSILLAGLMAVLFALAAGRTFRRVRLAEPPAVETWWWTAPFAVLLCAGLIWWQALDLWQRIVVDAGICGIALANWWANRRRRNAWRSLLIIAQGISTLLMFHWLPREVHFLEVWLLLGYAVALASIYLLYGWDQTDHWAAQGLCLGCGYDIRCQSDRCPECALPIAPRTPCSNCHTLLYATLLRCPTCGIPRRPRADFISVYDGARHKHHGGAQWTRIHKTCGSGLQRPVIAGSCRSRKWPKLSESVCRLSPNSCVGVWRPARWRPRPIRAGMPRNWATKSNQNCAAWSSSNPI